MHHLLDTVVRSHGAAQAIQALRDELARSGGPLRAPADGGRTEVSFVWIGDARSVSVQCGLVDHAGRSTPMQRLLDTSVWVHSVLADSDTLVSYRFVLDDPFADSGPLDDEAWQRTMLEAQSRSFADPFNPQRIRPLSVLFGLEPDEAQWESVLALDHAPQAPWFEPHSAPVGQLDDIEFAPTDDPGGRTITVWTPHGTSPERLPLAVLLDGSSWLTIAQFPQALDAAVASGELRPMAVAFVHPARASRGLADRTVELSCNARHSHLLAETLIPHLHGLLGTHASPTATVLGGASLGGLMSTYTAMEYPLRIGAVLSVSGSYWYGTERDGTPEWLTRRLATEPRRPFRIHQQIGRLEDSPLALSPGVSHLVANRHFRDVAIAKGHDLSFDETTTAHDIVAFRVAAMRGLLQLLPGDR